MTSNLQFSGMEASTCVFITNNMTEETGARSGLLRATSRMVVISYTKNINLDEVKKRFVVLNLITIILNDEKKKRKEERREVEYKINPLAVEVDTASKKGEIALVKQLQLLEKFEEKKKKQKEERKEVEYKRNPLILHLTLTAFVERWLF